MRPFTALHAPAAPTILLFGRTISAGFLDLKLPWPPEGAAFGELIYWKRWWPKWGDKSLDSPSSQGDSGGGGDGGETVEDGDGSDAQLWWGTAR